MKKHYETHVEDTDKLISVAGPVLDYKSWYEQYRKLMEEQAQRKYGLYTPTSEGDDDDFPSIPGMIARYSALGLTNEQMAANPVWVDKTGNGHDLQMKNFLWGGMSGIGGYVADIDEWGTNSTAAYFERNSIKITATFKENASLGLLYHNIKLRQSCVLKVTGIPEGCDAFLDDRLGNRFYMSEDGVYEIIPSNFLAEALYLSIEKYPERWYGSKLTIEQLPLYPGFILGDGVDDFAVTEKELNFEDTYTVYTAFIPFQDDPIRGMVVCGKDFKKDFYLYYSDTHLTYYTSGLNDFIPVHINQFHIIVCKRDKTNAVIKNLITGESKTFSVSELINNPGVYYLWRYYQAASYYAKAAIAGQIIANGHFTTDEEDENILNWHKKQYPWLFPDQAWTTVGKTNEDEDRATIANITGNGNDLVLSNFGFAKGSGYGLYYQYFGEKFATTNGEIEDGGWNKIDNYNISHNKRIPINSIGKCYWSNEVFANGIKLRFKLTGMTEGDVLAFGYAGTYDLTYTSDGIYVIDLPPVDKTYGFSLQSSLTENLPTTPVTIKLLPFEYEGYLVTDGVDDKIASSDFKMGKDFTIVGDWKFINNKKSGTGLVKGSSFYIYNTMTGLDLYINSGSVKNSLDGIKSINAACSDGRAYDRNWNEILANTGNVVGSGGTLEVSSSGGRFDRIAFKNLAIYPRILSKDDCIKAYNYLQTLKAK